MKYEVPTSAGVFAAELQEGRLVSLNFPNGSGRISPSVNLEVSKLQAELEEYLQGKRKEFTIAVDLGGGTEFQRKVWRAMQRIPFGQTKSYGEIAHEIGAPKASRAVGGACGRNPIPVIVPCHRVLAGHQRLGGFSSGLEWKKRLLALEGVAVRK